MLVALPCMRPSTHIHAHTGTHTDKRARARERHYHVICAKFLTFRRVLITLNHSNTQHIAASGATATAPPPPPSSARHRHRRGPCRRECACVYPSCALYGRFIQRNICTYIADAVHADACESALGFMTHIEHRKGAQGVGSGRRSLARARAHTTANNLVERD